MPTFYDPVADAEEASQALRGLAHASIAFEHPEDAYGVIGDLLAGVRSLQQSIRQLAARHTQHDGRAFNDAGDQAAGIGDAHLTARELTDAATALDAVEERLNNASAAAGRIAWHPASPDAGTTPAAEPAIGEAVAGGGTVEPVQRWVNVVFLQGSEADEVLWLIDRDGPEAAIDHLAGYDHGQETTDTAMENGYVYDTPPTSALDKQAVQDDYALIHNPDMGHIGLYRRHQVHPADRIDTTTDKALATGRSGAAAGAAGASAGAGAAAGAAMPGKAFGHRATSSVAKGQSAAGSQKKSWFAHPGVEAVKRDHGISR